MVCPCPDASASTFNVTASASNGHPINSLAIGDEVTIHIRMINPTGAAIWGVGAGIQGWDNSIAQFLSGEMYVGP